MDLGVEKVNDRTTEIKVRAMRNPFGSVSQSTTMQKWHFLRRTIMWDTNVWLSNKLYTLWHVMVVKGDLAT